MNIHYEHDSLETQVVIDGRLVFLIRPQDTGKLLVIHASGQERLFTRSREAAAWIEETARAMFLREEGLLQ